MTASTQSATNCQIPFDGCEAVLITEIADFADERMDSPFWHRSIPEQFDRRFSRNTVANLFLSGACGATEAYEYLAANDLFGDVQSFMQVYCQGLRSISGGVRHG